MVITPPYFTSDRLKQPTVASLPRGRSLGVCHDRVELLHGVSGSTLHSRTAWRVMASTHAACPRRAEVPARAPSCLTTRACRSLLPAVTLLPTLQALKQTTPEAVADEAVDLSGADKKKDQLGFGTVFITFWYDVHTTSCMPLQSRPSLVSPGCVRTGSGWARLWVGFREFLRVCACCRRRACASMRLTVSSADHARHATLTPVS